MNKVFAIFGASGGIGSALSKLLSTSTDKVYLIGRNQKKLQELSQLLSQPFIVADAINEESVGLAFQTIVNSEGRLDGVASLVGSVFLKPILQTTMKEFSEVITLNVMSSFCILKHALDSMQSGSIVLTSSTASLIGIRNHEAIAAAKGAINGLIISAAASYAYKKIRVNGIAPGLTRTQQTSYITDNKPSLDASTKLHPLGRIAEPNEIASLIAWLLSDESSFMTGNVIPIDGGLSRLKC